MSPSSKGATMAESKRVASVFESIRTFVYAVLLAVVFRSLVFEPFHIPSGSMLSTLFVGDYIFVSKYAYGYSRYSFPFAPHLFDGRLAERVPERGDIVVFRLPTDPKIDYIKRLVGLPGDTIRVHDGLLFINGEPVKREHVEDFSYVDGKSNVQRHIKQYKETLPNGVSHNTLDETSFGEVDFTGDYIVPEGYYFMMGDNRDNSVDSRYTQQVGFVPAENLIGRAEIILFSIDKDVNFEFWEFWKYPEMFRAGRSFKIL